MRLTMRASVLLEIQKELKKTAWFEIPTTIIDAHGLLLIVEKTTRKNYFGIKRLFSLIIHFRNKEVINLRASNFENN